MTKEYAQLLQAVEQYYGSGSDQWLEITKYGLASDKAEEILRQVPGVNIVKNANGKIRSYNFNATENIASTAESAVNSNTPPVIKSFNIPANTGMESVTTPAGETVKHMTFKSGMAQAGNFVFGEVAPAVVAAATGITLGKTIDKLLYNVNPDFWDEHRMETLNPDVWGDIIGTDSVGGRVMNMILGTTPDNKTQAYIDQNALAYMAYYMQSLGIFNQSIFSGKVTNEESTIIHNEFTNYYFVNTDNGKWTTTYNGSWSEWKANKTLTYGIICGNDSRTGTGYICSKESFTASITYKSGDKSNITAIHSKVNNDDIYYYPIASGILTDDIYSPIVTPTISNNSDALYSYAIWLMLYGSNISEQSSIDGITNQSDATIFDPSNVTDIASTLQELKKQYPNLFNNAVTQNVVQPDGSTVTYTYVPVSMPELDPDGNPVSSISTQNDPQVNPETATQPLLDLITKIIQKDPPINPPDTGGGNTPIVTPPKGSASALYAIYNPTLAQINSFGTWLWSDNFIDQIKKLFNDPMQAIIGLHKVYATPSTSGSANIKVGYLDSGVSAKIVSNQYTTVDCGTVSLSEYFYNVFDYAPYTDINLYLPFIGIVGLDVADVMRSSIHIIYHVDVLSGACLAEVKVIRDNSGGTLYQYTGNASVTLPISSGSYMGIVSSIAGIAGGIAGTIASGGSALPMLVSSAGSILNARTKVEHSGGFSGNAGAMGSKVPYLIISRPQVELANNFERYIGYPANITTTLGACSGFVNVLECHLENIHATDSELSEIESLLKGGIIV